MDQDQLMTRVTVAQAEALHMAQIDELGPDPLPFGFANERWRALVAQMQEGDELWTFISSPESWARRSGRAGIALVRDGKVVDSLVTTSSSGEANSCSV
jgi:hypothetical protein